MGNNVVISGSSGRADWCFLSDAAYESILLSITYSYFCSSESCTRRHAGGQSFSWETLRRKQWQQWHVLLADLLLNLCTLINLSTVPARASPPSEECHVPQWPVSYVWLWFWCKLCKNFPSETLNLFCHIRECVSPAHSLGAFGECECRMGIWNRLEKLQTRLTVTVFTENALLWFRRICVVYRTSIPSVYSTAQLININILRDNLVHN